MAPFGVKVACIEPGFFKTNVTDTESMKNNLRKLWERLPQDVKDDYGPGFMGTCELINNNKLFLHTSQNIEEMTFFSVKVAVIFSMT